MKFINKQTTKIYAFSLIKNNDSNIFFEKEKGRGYLGWKGVEKDVFYTRINVLNAYLIKILFD